MKTSLVLCFGYAAAAALPKANDVPSRIVAARPGAVVERQEPSGTVTASWTSNSNSSLSTASISIITGAPTLGSAVLRGGAPCTPSSICEDKATMMDCGNGSVLKRYGGCYDKNFCVATTSYPPPTCG